MVFHSSTGRCYKAAICPTLHVLCCQPLHCQSQRSVGDCAPTQDSREPLVCRPGVRLEPVIQTTLQTQLGKVFFVGVLLLDLAPYTSWDSELAQEELPIAGLLRQQLHQDTNITHTHNWGGNRTHNTYSRCKHTTHVGIPLGINILKHICCHNVYPCSGPRLPCWRASRQGAEGGSSGPTEGGLGAARNKKHSKSNGSHSHGQNN